MAKRDIYPRWESPEQQQAFRAFVCEHEPEDLHGPDLYWLHNLVGKIAKDGRVPQPKAIGRMGGLLRIGADDLLRLLPARDGEGVGSARAVFRLALARSGLNLQAAADAAGLDPGSVQDWLDGRAAAFSDHAERLAAAVGAPELLGALRIRPRRITMRCRDCGEEKEYRPAFLNTLIRRREERLEESRSKARTVKLPKTLPPVELDGDGSRGVYTCVRCTRVILGKELDRKLVRNEGAQGRYWRGIDASEKRWKRADRAQRRRIGEELAERNRTRQRNSAELTRRALAALSLDPKGRFSLCAMCEKLIFTTAAADRFAAERATRAGVFHVACLREWRGDPRMRAWLAKGHAKRKRGVAEAPMPLPARKEGRKATATELLDMYRALVLLLWQQEDVGGAKRDEYGKPISISELARQLNLSRLTLYGRATRFVQLLPSEPVASGRVDQWRKTFLALWHREAKDGNDGLV